ASETFRGSGNLSAFLRFVVEATLRGEQDRIKGYTIGVEALGRPQAFDPQTDPIVRVEATRLRRTLERYNAGEGANDPIAFELSRGSYVPVIRRREIGQPASAMSLAAARSRPARARRIGVAFVAMLLVLALAALWSLIAGPGAIRTSLLGETDGFDGPLQPGNGMPTLKITPIGLLGIAPAPGAARPQAGPGRATAERLRAAIARFDTLNVVGDAIEASSTDTSPPDYELIGTGEWTVSDGLTVRFRLLDAAATTIWSRDFTFPLVSADYVSIEEKITAGVAQALAPPFGVIRAHERVLQLAGNKRDPRYRCTLEASESLRSFDPAQRRRARSCLERLTERYPAFALGFSFLAAIYKREYQYGLGDEADTPDLLDRALRLAEHGIELAPQSARAHQILSTVLFQRGQLAAALAANEKAIALNELDTTILSDYGGQLIMAGEVARGLEVLGRAADEGSVRPSWYRFYLFLGHYLQKDVARASDYAAQVPPDAYPIGPLARTLAAILSEDAQRARSAFEALSVMRPAWRSQARVEVARLFPPPSADRVLRDLVSAGLATAD
ncbi:MAG: hypothetical protein JO000_04850, partial [Alphaproteobacteria bacterium]|nr:hypothetical protein [Alphaproteobacteria bacterium]